MGPTSTLLRANLLGKYLYNSLLAYIYPSMMFASSSHLYFLYIIQIYLFLIAINISSITDQILILFPRSIKIPLNAMSYPRYKVVRDTLFVSASMVSAVMMVTLARQCQSDWEDRGKVDRTVTALEETISDEERHMVSFQWIQGFDSPLGYSKVIPSRH